MMGVVYAMEAKKSECLVHLDHFSKLLNMSSCSQKPMTTLCQMEILNSLWLNWVQYLPPPTTQINIPPSHPQGGVQISPNANLLSKTMNLKVHHRQQRPKIIIFNFSKNCFFFFLFFIIRNVIINPKNFFFFKIDKIDFLILP